MLAVSRAIDQAWNEKGRFPGVWRGASLLAAGTFGFIMHCFTSVLFFAATMLFSKAMTKLDIVPVAQAYALFAVAGFGFGLIFNAIRLFVRNRLVDLVLRGLVRFIIMHGGAFFIPDLMPIYVRPYLTWNPAMHGISMARQGFYTNFPAFLYNPRIFVITAFAMLIFGLALERLVGDRRQPRHRASTIAGPAASDEDAAGR
jgi:capsular polysaccharide transport system permease protein